MPPFFPRENLCMSAQPAFILDAGLLLSNLHNTPSLFSVLLHEFRMATWTEKRSHIPVSLVVFPLISARPVPYNEITTGNRIAGYNRIDSNSGQL